jgi:hypothetical protein
LAWASTEIRASTSERPWIVLYPSSLLIIDAAYFFSS